MTVTVTDVRNQLNLLTNEAISDDVIQSQINIATREVQLLASSSASSDDLDKAILMLASYYTYVVYSTSVEAATGFVPTPVLTKLTELQQIANRWLQYIQRSSSQLGPLGSRTIGTVKQNDLDND